MKLSISNIAWSKEFDEDILCFLNNNGFSGLEIAPTRFFPNDPYDNLEEARNHANKIKEVYGLTISSIQSIWYGVSESIFSSEASRKKLIDYTKKAVDFACAMKCPNIVFGCPKNRVIPTDVDSMVYLPIAYDFFEQIGRYAADQGTYISIEPNPTIYNTNFINTTEEAFDICKKLNNPGIKVNIDLGTIIYNNERIEMLKDYTGLINHIHISEPYLVPIEKRALHNELIHELKKMNYDKFLSIEMGNPNNIDLVKKTILYIKEVLT